MAHRAFPRKTAAPWAAAWQRWVSSAFLRAYLEATQGAAFMTTAEDLPLLLTTHLLERAFTELRDELKRPPSATVGIPLQGIAELVGVQVHAT